MAVIRVKGAARIVLLAGLCVCALTAGAQSYPVKPVRFVVPSSAGGGSDVLARLFALKMSEHWGQQVVIDNRSGAGGIIGSEIVAQAAPDIDAIDQRIYVACLSRAIQQAFGP